MTMRRIDKIRNMSTEELAKIIVDNDITDAFCKSDCETDIDDDNFICNPLPCCIRWLEEESEEPLWDVRKCRVCGAQTHPSGNPEKVISSWNRRIDGWIPVSEQPKAKGVYHVKAYYPERSSEACEKIALWNGVVWIESIWFDWPQNNRINPQPTHWMPLPESTIPENL